VTADVRTLVFRALDNAIKNGYQAYLELSDSELAYDLKAYDAELENQPVVEIQKSVIEWRRRHDVTNRFESVSVVRADKNGKAIPHGDYVAIRGITEKTHLWLTVFAPEELRSVIDQGNRVLREMEAEHVTPADIRSGGSSLTSSGAYGVVDPPD
jgi:uncharacterized protein YciU (UPF0263 family)